MYRGTTPAHTFTTETDLSDAAVIYITYKQNGQNVLEKTKADITFDSEQSAYTMTVTLSQAETLAFDDSQVAIQIRARFDDGRAIASNVISVPVRQILKDGEI